MRLIGVATIVVSGDDWLTVNVWSPDLSGSSPVMVWIQGGGYAFGMSALPEYDAGDALKSKMGPVRGPLGPGGTRVDPVRASRRR